MSATAAKALAAVLLLGPAVACGPPPNPAPLAGYNLILINIDALRADHLGCYGYSRETSPFIDSLSLEAVVFDRASAVSTYTRESVAALFTGRMPSKSGALGWHAAPRPPNPTLAERLSASGYRTGLLSNTVMLRKAGFERGFDRVSHLPARWDLSGEGERLSDAAIAFVSETARRPYFLYLHYLDPHAPYAPAPEYLRRFGNAEPTAPLALYGDVTQNLPTLRQTGFGPGDPRFEAMLRRYDAEIAATDAALQHLFRALATQGILDRTLVVITSDHGEEFLEHGWVEHGWTLYDETLRVPLLLWAPTILKPARIRERFSQIDLVPTLLALLGIPATGDLDGTSAFEIDDAGVRPRTDDRVQIAELLLAKRQVVRAVLRDDWKYIASWRQVAPEDRAERAAQSTETALDLWGPPVREELFDLRSDPGEMHDRIASEVRIHRELAAILERFRDRGPNYGFAAADAIVEVYDSDRSNETEQRLRALGYAE